MTSTTRHVPIEGTLNFRDLGGYIASDGRVVAPGLVYRSDDFSKLTDAGRQALSHLGVSAVHDMRADREVTTAPNLLPVGVDWVRSPINTAGTQQGSMLELIAAGVIQPMSIDELGSMYCEMLDDYAPQMLAVVEGVATADHRPVVFHCTAGKDRTGVAAALILDALGVSREDIIYDYHLTDTYRTPHRLPVVTELLAAAGIEAAGFVPLFSAPEPVIAAMLDYLHEQFGGAVGYLVDYAKGAPDLARALADRLLVKA